MNPLYVVIVVVVAVAGLQTVRLSKEQASHERTKTMHATTVSDWNREARVAVEAARTEEQRRTQAVQKEAQHARNEQKRLAGDLADAERAGQLLRDALASLGAPSPQPGPNGAPATGGSPATDPTADLRALVQRRLDAAADGVAGFADRAYLAGSTCQRSWGTLTAPASTTP